MRIRSFIIMLLFFLLMVILVSYAALAEGFILWLLWNSITFITLSNLPSVSFLTFFIIAFVPNVIYTSIRTCQIFNELDED